MRIGYRACTAIAVASLLGCIGSASAEPLTLPAWSELFSKNGDLRAAARGRTDSAVFFGERLSAGRAIERTVLARVRGSAQADRDRVVSGRVASGFDLGNVYALAESSQDDDLHVFIASEHTFTRTTDSIVEYSLYRAPHRLRFGDTSARVLGHDVAGDLRIKVLVRDGAPRGLAIQRRTGGAWRRIMRARFGASGCAGNRQRALVCVKTLASGGPVATARTGRDANGGSVALPVVSNMIEIGLNLGALVNANATVSSIAVRTERDIVVGQLKHKSKTTPGGGS